MSNNNHIDFEGLRQILSNMGMDKEQIDALINMGRNMGPEQIAALLNSANAIQGNKERKKNVFLK